MSHCQWSAVKTLSTDRTHQGVRIWMLSITCVLTKLHRNSVGWTIGWAVVQNFYFFLKTDSCICHKKTIWVIITHFCYLFCYAKIICCHFQGLHWKQTNLTLKKLKILKTDVKPQPTILMCSSWTLKKQNSTVWGGHNSLFWFGLCLIDFLYGSFLAYSL